MDGNRLRELRKERKLTQAELGKHINVSKVSISGYENGERTPDTDNLARLADFFGVTIDYLLGRSDIPDKTVKEQAEEAYNDPDFQYAMRSLNGMDQESKEEVLNFIEYVLQREKGRKPGQRQPNPPRFNKE